MKAYKVCLGLLWLVVGNQALATSLESILLSHQGRWSQSNGVIPGNLNQIPAPIESWFEDAKMLEQPQDNTKSVQSTVTGKLKK